MFLCIQTNIRGILKEMVLDLFRSIIFSNFFFFLIDFSNLILLLSHNFSFPELTIKITASFILQIFNLYTCMFGLAVTKYMV